MGATREQILLIVLFFVGLLIVYFVPYFVARVRSHPRSTAILLLNVLLGWTTIGWIGALAWAFIDPRRD